MRKGAQYRNIAPHHKTAQKAAHNQRLTQGEAPRFGWGRRTGRCRTARMLAALFRAVAALSLPPLRRVVAISLGLAVASFILLWIGVATLVDHVNWFAWAPLHWLVDLLGAVAVLFLSWLLFPAVTTIIASFFLDSVAGTVEALDYPGQEPARAQPIGEMLRVTIRLMLLTIALNLLALPVYVLAPGINVFVFLLLNGYLFGREYFEVVALRRLDRGAATAMRQRFAGRVFAGGVVIAALFALPLVNLLAPVIATAFMVHVFERMRRLGPPALVC
jgi:CysZ protein